jgi:hypothetical protein
LPHGEDLIATVEAPRTRLDRQPTGLGGNNAIGVNQSLPEGVSSTSEAIHAASAHMHVNHPRQTSSSEMPRATVRMLEELQRLRLQPALNHERFG